MNFQNYTQKSLEAVQNAKNLAIQNSNQQMEQVHLLLALLQQEGGLIPQLLRKMDVTVESLEAAANTELRKLPAVTGSREADRFYISADVDAAFNAAEAQAKVMKDEFVSVEHLFLGLLETAKGGIAALTHALAVSLAGRVRVNSISPGWIDTAYRTYEGPDATQQPAGRVGHPMDIAHMVLFLCSDKAGFITGENICIDGGMTRQMIYHGDWGWRLDD